MICCTHNFDLGRGCMDDTELKNILFSIQSSIITLHGEVIENRNALHKEIADTKESLYESLHKEIADTKESLYESLHKEIADTKESLYESLHKEIADTKESLSSEMAYLRESVKKLEVTIENDIQVKISVLYDARMDEIRHRKENKETLEKTASLEMRVDNLERVIKAS